MVTVPPSGEYFTALLTRLLTTWTSRSRSPVTMGSRGSKSGLNSTIDEAVAAIRVIEYVAAVRTQLVRLEPTVTDELAEALDAGERRAEFVGHDRQELRLCPVELFQVAVGALLRRERLLELVLRLAHGGHVLDYQQHVLRPSLHVGYRCR